MIDLSSQQRRDTSSSVVSSLQPSALVRMLARRPTATLLLIAGVLVSWFASQRQGQDYSTLYVTARALIERAPLYDLAWQKQIFPSCCALAPPLGMFYPPATGIAVLPLALLPYELSAIVWFSVSVLVLIGGVRALVRTLRPAPDDALWMSAAGLLLLSAAVRWGITPLQAAPLLLGLLCFTVAALESERWRTALAITLFVTALKITLALPFLGLLFVYGRYRGIVVALSAAAALNVLAFMQLGGESAVRAYIANTQLLEAYHDVNTPDAWSPISVPRTDLAYLLHGIGVPLQLARLGGLMLSGLAGLWFAWLVFAAGSRPSSGATHRYLMPMVCLSLVCVYHHHYDIALVMAPFVMRIIATPGVRPISRAEWALVPLALVASLAPTATLLRAAVTLLGPQWRGCVTLLFPTVVALALVGSLAALTQHVLQQRARRGLLPVSDGTAGELRST
jgi:hypothetical protein